MALFFLNKKRDYTDVEVVKGLQCRNVVIEEWFFEKARRYFDSSFNEIFFDADRKQEVFQTAFIKLWTEIENKKIRIVDDALCRQQTNLQYEPMRCSLTTFLMAFAKTEHREMMRNVREEYCEEVFGNSTYSNGTAVAEEYDDIEELKNRIVDECIQEISSGCAEILTLFYYEGKSLDEIMEIRKEKNTSKNGLKSAKNKCMSTLKERVTEKLRNYNI